MVVALAEVEGVTLAATDEEEEGIKLAAEMEEDADVCVGAAALDVGEVITAVDCPISVAPKLNVVVD